MTETTGFGPGRLLVVAFEGWNDAGDAASGAVATLREQLTLAPLFELEPEDYFDYQFNRPTVALNENGDRALTWPSVTFLGPRDEEATDTSIYLLTGTEPSRGWKVFTAKIIEVIQAHDITGVIFLGAMLADVPHTRPISTFLSSENVDVRSRLEIERSSYEGPVGILSVLADGAERAGIPTLSIWASVPHYVHNAPSPKATLALIEKLEKIIKIDIPRGDLRDEAVAWESGIDALASDDDDMSSYIEQLEQARDTVDSPEASGDAIAEEFERYLRRGGEGKGDSHPAGEGPWRPES